MPRDIKMASSGGRGLLGVSRKLFLPNWYIKVVKPGKEIPRDQVQFHVPMTMTKIDIKNYLERIYNIRVAKVNTRIQAGKVQRNNKNVLVKKRKDVKIAYVTLVDQTFQFPDIFGKALKSLQESEETKESTL